MILSRFLAALRAPAVQTRPAPESPRYSSPVWSGSYATIPPDLHLSLDQQVAVSVAWACVRAIVDPIAASEIKVYEEAGGKRDDEQGWLYWLLNVAPHPQYTSQGWLEVMGTRAVAAGNSYAYVLRDMTGRAAAMQPLEPARMRAEEEGEGVAYLYSDPLRGEVRMAEADVIHFRGPRSGGFYGDSAFARGAAALALAKAQEDYATSYYANGAYPGVLLKPPADMKGGAPTREEKATLREIWRALFGGPRKAHGVATMDPGWELEVVETDAQKAQMIEARRFQVAEVCRYFGVPGHLVGVPEASQGYGKNLAELGIAFTRYTLEPWCRRFEEELRRKLMPSRRQGQSWFIEFNLERLKQGDAESVARAAEIDLRNGVLTINEARALRGMPSIVGGDIVTINGKPIETLVAETSVAKLSAQPEIYQYHLEGGILTKNEVRRSLGLPPVAGGDEFTEPVQVKVDREQAENLTETADAVAPVDEDTDERDGPEKPEAADAAASVNTRPASLAAALDAHRRRVKARTADLRRTGKDGAVAEHVARLRARALGEVRALSPDLPSEAVTTALVSVEQGAPPDKAASHLLGAA